MLYDKRWDAKVETRVLHILIEARKLVEREENWCQAFSEERIRPNGKPYFAICAVHALQEAWKMLDPGRSNMNNEVDAYRALGRAIGVEGYGPDIGNWNDAKGRAHAEILAAFDRAIAEQRG